MSNSNVCFGDIVWTKWKNQSSTRRNYIDESITWKSDFVPNPDLKDET